MRAFIVACIATLLLFSCNNSDKAPDVSDIKINLSTERFEKKLFDSASLSFVSYLQELQNSSPQFVRTYLIKILGADPSWPADTTAAYVNNFISAYKPIYRDSEKKIKDFSKIETSIKYSLQLTKYYFPKYKVPEKIFTYIGPADGYTAIISNEGLLIGLQGYLGYNHPVYKTEMVSQFYPEYISQRFEPEYIPVDGMKAILNTDLYPETENDKSLVNEMVEKGKRLYILQKLLPDVPGYMLIGYKEKQMKWCDKNEPYIWDFFVKNSLLQSTDKNLMKNYIEEGPNTQELGPDSPGNIGSYAGWQIVKKYMDKKPTTTLEQLIKVDEEIIFQEAKYKP